MPKKYNLQFGEIYLEGYAKGYNDCYESLSDSKMYYGLSLSWFLHALIGISLFCLIFLIFSLIRIGLGL